MLIIIILIAALVVTLIIGRIRDAAFYRKQVEVKQWLEAIRDVVEATDNVDDLLDVRADIAANGKTYCVDYNDQLILQRLVLRIDQKIMTLT